MHVLMFGWEFPPRISGGLGRACEGITGGLAEKGVRVSFVMPAPMEWDRSRHREIIDRECSRKPRPVGGELHNLLGYGEAPEVLRANDSLHLGFLESPLMPYMTEGAYRALRGDVRSNPGGAIYGPDIFSEVDRYGLKARSLAEEASFDIIHAHDWMTVPAALEAKRISGKPLVLHIHSLESDRSGLRMNERTYAIERTGMTEADCVIAVSRYTAEKIVAQYGIPPAKVTVVHNAATLPDHRGSGGVEKDPSRKYVLFLGRITGQKGPGYFIEAAARVIGKYGGTHFIMAGEGDLLSRMREMARDMNIEKNIHFTGFMPDEEVGALYRISDLFVLTSVSEPFGMTVLEALSCGTPVIVSKNAGVLEVVPDCMTADPRNVEEMAEKITTLLKDGETGKAMVEMCRNRIHDLTWKNVAGSLIDIYRAVTIVRSPA